MIRATYRLAAFAIKAALMLLCGLVLLGWLPLPLLFRLAALLGRGVVAFFSLPAPVVGVATGFVVAVGLGKWLHNAPLKAQRSRAIQKAQAEYEAFKW